MTGRPMISMLRMRLWEGHLLSAVFASSHSRLIQLEHRVPRSASYFRAWWECNPDYCNVPSGERCPCADAWRPLSTYERLATRERSCAAYLLSRKKR